MKYPYIVNKNGVYYSAGTEVPEDNKGDRNQHKYTKTEINRMPNAELRELALDTGVEGADKMTGADLKKCLIQVFGLQE